VDGSTERNGKWEAKTYHSSEICQEAGGDKHEIYIKAIKQQSHVRNNEEDKTVGENERDQTRTNALRCKKLVGGKDHDDKVEAHGVDKDSRKDGVVGFRDDASSRWVPFRLQKNTWTVLSGRSP
jgi:hypothetical protein